MARGEILKRVQDDVGGLVSFFYFGCWLLALHYVMLKFAVKREQSQACLGYAEREQIEQS